MEHLNYYSSYYNNAIETAIELATKKNWTASKEFTSTWLGKKSIASVHPDNQKAIKTPKAMNPSSSSVEANVVQRFIAHQEVFLTLVDSAKNVNLNKPKIRIEVMKLLQLRLGDVLLFMTAHHQRHCNQALRALALTNDVCS